MTLRSDFKTFCDDLVLDTEDMETTCGEIAKKLNSHYYDLVNEKSEHLYIVGSVGRETAIAKTSDLDIVFDLPNSVYTRFENYSGNGQSALLQVVKEVLQERYPKTDISGDGQVVAIGFAAYTVELVPAFKQTDDKFKYPNTHEGGSWKTTDPIAEQNECEVCNTLSSRNYFNFCRMVRKWKSNCGVVMGGLLIDTLIYNHFKDNSYHSHIKYSGYFDVLLSLMAYLKGLDKEQEYWLAVGSNQHVYNKGNGSFIGKAKKAHASLTGCDTDEKKYEALEKLFGSDFPNTSTEKESRANVTRTHRNTEEFIENKVSVDIRYNVRIDCDVTQNGFRDNLLSRILRDGGFLRHNKSLRFFIQHTDVPQPYSVWWKVCNVGPEAERRDMIRGDILKNYSDSKKESTSFYGPHFVECYVIQNGICVARDRIDVPIGTV